MPFSLLAFDSLKDNLLLNIVNLANFFNLFSIHFGHHFQFNSSQIPTSEMKLSIYFPFFLIFLSTIYSINVNAAGSAFEKVIQTADVEINVEETQINVKKRKFDEFQTNVKKRKFEETEMYQRNVKRKLDMTILENVCVEKMESESPKSHQQNRKVYHIRRTKRNPIADLVVSNLVSVITGSFTNDFIMSNFWDKLTFCFRTVFLGEHFFRGWKRCWEYWRLGEQKWRKALKPHIVANIHRMALEKLKETDKEGRRLQQAMTQIQEEFNKILMDGSQTVRMLNILRKAGLQLPDLQWQPNPIQEEMDPVEMGTRILEKDWRATSFEFHSIFNIYNTILNILEEEFEKLFVRIQDQNAVELFKGGIEINEAQKIVKFGNGSLLMLNYKHLMEKYKIGKEQYVAKYLSHLLEWMSTEMLTKFITESNQLFIHAVLANFVAQMLRSIDSWKELQVESLPSKESLNATLPLMENAIQLKKLSRCLLNLVNTKEEIVDEKNQKQFVHKFGDFEGFDRKYLNFDELNRKVKDRIEQIDKMIFEKKGQIDLENAYEKFALNVTEKYKEFLESNHNECDYASRVLELDIGQLNEEMTVILDGNKFGMESKDEDKKMVEMFESEIQNLFYPIEKKPKKLKNKEHIANRHGKAKELSEKEMRDLEELLILINLAILGQIMATDMVREKVELGEIVQMMNVKELILDERRPNKFKALAEKMLEWMYKWVLKLELSLIGRVVGGFKELPNLRNGTFDKELKKAKHEHLKKFVDDEFELYRKKIVNFLDTTLMVVKNVDQMVGGPTTTTIGIPMRLSMDEGRRNELSKLGEEKTLVEKMLKKMKYAKKVNLLGVMKLEERIVKGSENANPNIEDAHPRKKRLIDAIFWGLITGWLGNWISQYVDISKTLHNCLIRRDCKIVKTDDVLRRQREKGMLNFFEKSYKILLIKLIEIDSDKKPLKELNDKIGDFLLKAVHADGLDKHFDGNHEIGNIMLDLEILNFNDFRHHIEQIIANDTEEGESSQEEVILGALSEFASNGWLHKDPNKNYEICVKNHKRILERIKRKECQKEMLKAQMDWDKFEEIYEQLWYAKNPFTAGICRVDDLVEKEIENDGN